MKNLDIVKNYCKKMELKEVMLDETCCLALGIAIGLGMAAKKSRPLLMATAAGVAMAAGVPLVTGVIGALKEIEE